MEVGDLSRRAGGAGDKKSALFDMEPTFSDKEKPYRDSF
jgi:hypothetical protein